MVGTSGSGLIDNRIARNCLLFLRLAVDGGHFWVRAHRQLNSKGLHAILEPGGGFLYNGTNIFPDDLFGANTKSSLNFSHIPLGLLVYFFHTGTGPPDMAKCGAFSLC